MKDSENLLQLIRSRHRGIKIITTEEAYAREVISLAMMECGLTFWVWDIVDGLRNGYVKDASPIKDTEKVAAAFYYLTKNQHEPCVLLALDLVGNLKNDARALRTLRNLLTHFDQTGSTLILLDHEDELPDILASTIMPFDISYPDEAELEEIVTSTLRSIHRETPIEVEISRKDLNTILRHLKGLTRSQVRRITADMVLEDKRFDADDVNSAITQKRRMMQTDGLLEFVETPASLEDIGGLGKLKQWLKYRENSMSEKAGEFGLESPRGVLLLGIQGAGKSLCAKAIAAAWQRPLLRMDTGALYDKYIGESERRLRMSLKQAEMMSPNILWIDEIEKAFASAASKSNDGGLSQRMFGTLLTWMQEHQEPVFLVATANDIEALPPELLRKGRFDEIFFVDLPPESTREKIFEIHLRKRQRDAKGFDLGALARAAQGFSGAEIEQAVIGAMHGAFAENKELTTEMILDVVKQSPPLSVTMREKIAELREWADGRCVPAE